LLALPLTGIAAPGDLDPSFDGDGKVITDFGGEEDALAIALQQDGRIVAAGQFADPTDPTGTGGFALSRYRGNGELDTSFDQDGRVILEFAGAGAPRSGNAQAVVVQPNGRIVAGGTVFEVSGEGFTAGESNARTGFALARFRPDGSLDMSFGEGGVAITDRLNASGIFALALQVDGKIVAAGQAFNRTTSRSDIAVARYLPNGKLDQSFGDGGVVITDVGANDFARAVAIQPNGRIVVAGVGDPTFGQLEFAVARYRPNGTLDPTFGNNGVVTTFVGDGYSATALALQPDGRIIAAGRNFSAGSDIALVRYLANGTLDPIFGDNGRVLADLGQTEQVNGLVLQQDGRLVTAGSLTNSLGERSFLVARFEQSGALDTTFSGVGYVITDVSGNAFSSAFALALQSNGRIVVAGHARDSEGSSDFALTRYFAQ
jgi:uncharacterized delta-60 repeat protein